MYSFVVSLHVLSVFVFLMAHGVSIVVYFMIPRQPSVERVRTLMALRGAAAPVMGIAFLTLIVTGIAAASIGQWWGRGWVWASIGVLLAVFVAMSVLGRSYFDRIEKLFKPGKEARFQVAGGAIVQTQELVPVLRNSHPRILSAIGLTGLTVILWLMMYKPF